MRQRIILDCTTCYIFCSNYFIFTFFVYSIKEDIVHNYYWKLQVGTWINTKMLLLLSGKSRNNFLTFTDWEEAVNWIKKSIYITSFPPSPYNAESITIQSWATEFPKLPILPSHPTFIQLPFLKSCVGIKQTFNRC